MKDLRSSGWTIERLAKNELPASHLDEHFFPYSHEQFWKTIRTIRTAIGPAEIPPIFIKCIRTYPYFDSNVDLLVNPSRLAETIGILCSAHWKLPTGMNRVEQALVERGKVKLSPLTPDLLPAHVYGGLRWGYQNDTGLLRTKNGEPDPVMLRRHRLTDAASQPATSDADSILHPFGAGELVVQAAHITSENFRITLGEAIHIQSLLDEHGCFNEALGLAAGFGFAGAVELVTEASKEILSDVSSLDPNRFPRRLPAARLHDCFLERYHYLRRSGRRSDGIIELGTCEAFLALRRVLRTVRRWRRGYEDRRS
jgi:hypothetical protein